MTNWNTIVEEFPSAPRARHGENQAAFGRVLFQVAPQEALGGAPEGGRAPRDGKAET